MTIEQPAIVGQLSPRIFKARIPVAAYGNEPVPADLGSFKLTQAGDWVHILVSPTVARGIRDGYQKFLDSELLAQASIIASTRGSYVWDIDVAIADGSAADKSAVQAWRERNPTPPFSSSWPAGPDNLESIVAQAREIVGRMRHRAAQQSSLASMQTATPASAPETEAVQALLDPKRAGSLGQGYEMNSGIRKVIELHAMREAIRHLEAQGWQCEDVSDRQAYDLRCTRPGHAGSLHVEVKGTTGDGSLVLLTPNEV